MEGRSKLSSLLEADAEPPHNTYLEAVDDTLKFPQVISDLGDALKLTIASRRKRFAEFCRLLRSRLPPPHSHKTQNIASTVSELLIEILPDLFLLLGPQNAVGSLAPALRICVIPSQPLGLRKLAEIISTCDRLLEHLASDPSGSPIVSRWACLPNTFALREVTQTEWTERLVQMILSCRGNHKIASTIQLWCQLNTLTQGLRSLESRLLRQASFPKLEDDLKHLLKVFDLAIPGSQRMVQSHIETLSSRRVSPILRSVLASFPCKYCTAGLGLPPQGITTEVEEHAPYAFDAGADLELEILGKAIGPWKIRLSPSASDSVRNLRQQDLCSSVERKLKDLASGRLVSKLAGSQEQRRSLKVPLALTSCGRKTSILWEVSLEKDSDSQLQRQIMTIWEVGDRMANSKAFDRVIVIQQGYSDGWANRCRQRAPVIDGKQLPVYFDNQDVQSNSFAVLDVRTIDQETIQMANKFYTLTEPFLRSIMASDLAAEFPLDLSPDEARCIRHFKTASLILGRSGTGKTTCLVFKLVGKFLASKAVQGGRPTHQVLLTRSMFLADKLKAYTRRLIRTLEMRTSYAPEVYSMDNQYDTLYEDHNNENVLTLSDKSFPLVCTFDQFLRILENTAVALDRQNFADVEVSPSASSHQAFLVRRSHMQQRIIDFYTFKVDFWPHFSTALVKGLSIHLVFAEIMGVIKGSESSRESLTTLSRAEYLDRSCRLAPTFSSEDERSRVYDVFEAYECMKQRRGGFDYVDRVVHLLKVVRQEPSLMQALRAKFDEVYIDEIQDHRSLDIELLLSIIRDGRGFHFAGDTAQAISLDSTFRFADVKKMLYERFAPVSETTNQHQLGHAEMFTLSKNYRSHQGILALASMVMQMIWEGFPETVDKLEPEVGTLRGPKPVLFVGCDTTILLSSSVASGKLSERSKDFGAEQVILVRDADTKKNVQAQIGDVALVFTILESKGMEFDDVILWNFFSECPDQAGVRSLEKLKREPMAFDSKRHSGMCSELKHLYVAVTRARFQLFIVETSEDTAISVQGLLEHNTPEALADVTGPAHEDFAVRVDMMRPNTSVDLIAWARRAEDLMSRHMFREAIMPFRRAGNHKGELTAQAFLEEEEGRVCRARNDINGSNRHFHVAHGHFMEIDRVADAVRVLIFADDFEAAANIWLSYDQYSKAASLFLRAGLYRKAVDCHHHAGEHSDAAAILRDEKQYDSLVYYLANNNERIPATILRRYSLLCKLLLKQRKLSTEHRIYAIKLLGSSQEQEACFRQYGMYEHLAALYKDQSRHKDLYHLYYRMGRLELALSLALTKSLLESFTDVEETQLLQLLDFSFASCYRAGTQRSLLAKLVLVSKNLTPNVLLKIEQWRAIEKVYTSQEPTIRYEIFNTEDSAATRFLSLSRVFNHEDFAQVSQLSVLPFGMMHMAVKISKDLVLKDDREAYATILLVTGLWKPYETEQYYVPLSWSPFYGGTKDFSRINFLQVAKKRFLDNVVSAISAVDGRARLLWRSQRPERCARFLTRGFYPNDSHSLCERIHRDVSPQEFSINLWDLLRVNSLICELAALYYSRVLNTTFQENYLGTRRHWLERLLREITLLSSLEQDTSVITKVQAEIMHNENFKVVRSSLEGLLYFRIKQGKEWSEKSTFTALLEQLQVAATFGTAVQNRLFRAISHRLHMDQRGLMREHLSLMNFFQSEIAFQPATMLKHKLRTFLKSLDSFEFSEMSTLHSLAALFEYLTTLLILMTCDSSRLLPKSWIDLYLPQILPTLSLAEPRQAAQETEPKVVHQQCLVELAVASSKTIRFLLSIPQLKVTLYCNGNPHPQLLLKPRLFGLLAIINANLGALSPPPTGFGQAWKISKETFGYDRASKQFSECKSPADIARKLRDFFSDYKDKDGLILIANDGQRKSAFSDLEKLTGVKLIRFDELCPHRQAPMAAAYFSHSSTKELAVAQEQYSPTEKQAVVKMQRFWRTYRLIIKARRTYNLLPKPQAFRRFDKLATYCPAKLDNEERSAIRKALVSKGVQACLSLAKADDTLRKLQEQAMDFTENLDISEGIEESVDTILSGNSVAESLVAKAAEALSDSSLTALVMEGILIKVEQAISEASLLVREAERTVLDTRKAMDSLTKLST